MKNFYKEKRQREFSPLFQNFRYQIFTKTGGKAALSRFQDQLDQKEILNQNAR